MKIINIKSEPRNNFFAPEWNYFIAEKYIKDVNFNELSKFILNKKKKILELPYTIKNNKFSDGNTGLGEKSVTARYDRYNVLSWKNKNVKKIKENILKFYKEFLKSFNFKLPKELYIQCWVNIMKKGEKINIHSHSETPNSYLSGHICVQIDNTSTFYINPINRTQPYAYESKNEVGKITLFQSSVPHCTSIHYSDKKRITIAFDISLNKIDDSFLKLKL
jgi:hypothetical protein